MSIIRLVIRACGLQRVNKGEATAAAARGCSLRYVLLLTRLKNCRGGRRSCQEPRWLSSSEQRDYVIKEKKIENPAGIFNPSLGHRAGAQFCPCSSVLFFFASSLCVHAAQRGQETGRGMDTRASAGASFVHFMKSYYT